VIFLNMNH